MGDSWQNSAHASYRGCSHQRVECLAREHEVTCVICLDQVVFALFVGNVIWQS
jgi:hypothetical protein